MKETLQVINRMQGAGIIGKYAIGGAIGATFYLEPTSTFDLDIFVSFGELKGSVLDPLRPIIDYLGSLGYKCESEHFKVEGWLVQFVPAEDALNSEALAGAVQTELEGIQTWVMQPEHLMAIALRLGRPKDFIRIGQFISEKAFSADTLDSILKRHGLEQKWESFNKKYIEEPA